MLKSSCSLVILQTVSSKTVSNIHCNSKCSDLTLFGYSLSADLKLQMLTLMLMLMLMLMALVLSAIQSGLRTNGFVWEK